MARPEIIYYRMTPRPAHPLQLDVQRRAVARALGQLDGVEVVDVLPGSPHTQTSPALDKALRLAQQTGSRLVIARWKSLPKRGDFLEKLAASGVEFVCADNPSARRATISKLAVQARIAAAAAYRASRAGLNRAKANGIPLGGFREGSGLLAQPVDHLVPIVREARVAGCETYAAIGRYLNDRGWMTSKGNPWQSSQVRKLLLRLSAECGEPL